MDSADRLTVPLADLDRLAQIVPDMPARQVAEMMRWIAEISPAQVYSLAPAMVIPDTVLHTLDMGDGRVLTSPDPIPEPLGAPDAAPAPARSYFEEKRAEIAAAKKVGPAQTNATAKPDLLDQTPKGWSFSEIETALAMHNTGQTYAAIAEKLGRPVPGTGFMMRKLQRGWRPKGWDEFQAGKQAPVAAEPQPKAVVAEPISPTPKAEPTAVEKPAPAAPSTLTGDQRDLMAQIMRLDDDFTPQDDLYLVDAILGRTPLDVIADQLGCDIQMVKHRWVALVGFDPKTRPGGIPLQHQSDLVAVLRVLAGEVAA